MYVYRCCTRIVSSFVFTPISNLHVDCLDSLRGERQKSLTLIGDSGWGFFFKTITKIETEHKRLELRFNLFDFNGKYPQCPSAAHTHPRAFCNYLRVCKTFQNCIPQTKHIRTCTYAAQDGILASWQPSPDQLTSSRAKVLVGIRNPDSGSQASCMPSAKCRAQAKVNSMSPP